MTMEFARGQLYQHRLRPQWGAGLFVGIIDGKPQLSFEDGRLRGFLPSSRGAFFEAVEHEQISEPLAAKPRKPATRPGPRVWTAERDAELRTLDALKLTEAEIAKRMGMSKDAVANRRSVLGLGRRALWSDADDARLRELVASKTPNVTIAAEMSRTLAAVRARRRHLDLGVELLPRWTASEDALACSDLPPEEIAASTGRSKRSVFNRRAKIGATKRPCKRWTAEDDARVRVGGSLETIALELGRTVGAVEHRARLLTGRSP
jgi:predicted DNA-binding protein (UPF0251 family)